MTADHYEVWGWNAEGRYFEIKFRNAAEMNLRLEQNGHRYRVHTVERVPA